MSAMTTSGNDAEPSFVYGHDRGIHGNDAEPSFVYGHDRAVPAQVLAAARRLGESERAGGSVGHLETGIAVESGQSVA